jgi:hypothetical protein
MVADRPSNDDPAFRREDSESEIVGGFGVVQSRRGPAPDKLAPIKDWLPTQLQRSNAITSRPSSQIHVAEKFDFFILE